MSAMRQDPSHRPGPAGWSRVRAAGEGDRSGGAAGVLSVVVPAKNEAASLPQLVDEIAEALRPLCGGRRARATRLDGFEIVIVDDGSTDETPAVLRQTGRGLPRAAAADACRATWGSRRRPPRASARRGATGWRPSTPTSRTTRPTWRPCGRPCRATTRRSGWRSKREDVWSKRVISRWANRVRNQVLGQSIRDTGCSVRIFPRAVACGCRCSRAAIASSARCCSARGAGSSSCR